MRKQFDPTDYLPVTTIKPYVSRRAAKRTKREKSLKMRWL